MPIFVAHDSADVWAHPELFAARRATASRRVVAGVPPDYFSATGQRWGNPLYRWDVLAADGYAWWIERFAPTAARWSTSSASITSAASRRTGRSRPSSETAEHGRWVPGPGRGAVRRGRRRRWAPCRSSPRIWASITPEVEALRRAAGLPGHEGAAVRLRRRRRRTAYLPHNYEPRHRRLHRHARQRHHGRLVRGSLGAEQRDARAPLPGARRQRHRLGPDPRSPMRRSPTLAIAPLQDVLGLGSEARMNLPGRGRRQLGLAFHRGRPRRRPGTVACFPGTYLRPRRRGLTRCRRSTYRATTIALPAGVIASAARQISPRRAAPHVSRRPAGNAAPVLHSRDCHAGLAPPRNDSRSRSLLPSLVHNPG